MPVTKKFEDLVELMEANSSDEILLHNGDGVKKITVGNLQKDLRELISTVNSTISNVLVDGAGAHNSIYRGKYLGGSVSNAQYEAIRSGKFTDLYIGDYWNISGAAYRIAHFDYYLNTGDVNCTTHHAVIVPDSILYSAQMNDTNTTSGGYKGSSMYQSGLETAKSTINSAFSGHVLKKRTYINTEVSNGRPSRGEWADSTVDLMNEHMVYGSCIFQPVSDGTNIPSNYRIEKTQLALFRLDPSRIINRSYWWLRDIISASAFASVAIYGYANYNDASLSRGVRPVFCIA